MKIETKYEIGEKLFWVDSHQNQYRIRFSSIKSINIGGKASEQYEIGNTTRAERELFTSFEAAKNRARECQLERNDRLLQVVEEQNEEMVKRDSSY